MATFERDRLFLYTHIYTYIKIRIHRQIVLSVGSYIGRDLNSRLFAVHDTRPLSLAVA